MCPEFPWPTEEVIDSIESMDDPEFNRWIIDVTKLGQTLEACNQ